jgi:proteasome lid subunit RPN8/RPN11
MEAIRAHLVRAYPEEGCGVLLGRDLGSERIVERTLALDNQRADSRHNRYLLSPEQLLAAEREARAVALDVVGFFHSHPDHPARPSAFDLEHAWPYYSYLIVGVERGRAAEARSWRLADDRSRFDPEDLRTPEGASRPSAGPGETG